MRTFIEKVGGGKFVCLRDCHIADSLQLVISNVC